MDKWFKYILPDKDPYHNHGRDQMRKKGGPDFKCLCKKVEEIILAMYFQNFLMKVFNTHLTLKSDPRESCFKNKNNMFAILRKNIL
jgi:hypothetical protein